MPDTKSFDPRDQYTTKWTEVGYRLQVTYYTGSFYLQVHAKAANLLDNQECFLPQANIGVTHVTPQVDARRFVQHCIGFFGDGELVEFAHTALDKVFNNLQPMGLSATPPSQDDTVN